MNVSQKLLSSFLCLGLLLASTSAAEAKDSCEDQAIAAGKQNKPHLVVSFEGLFIPAKGILYRRLITPLAKQKPANFFYQQYRYGQAEKATDCVLAWERVLGKGGFTLSVIGHSFGGGIGAPRFVQNMDRHGMRVKNLITLDPRDNSSRIFRCPSAEPGREKYSRFSNVDTQVSFYQCGSGLPGEHFSGVRNIEVKGFSHGSLPSSPLIYSITNQMIQ